MRAAAGETVSIELALAVESPRAAPERFHMTPVGWLGGSTATLGAAGFGVFYALASAQFQDLEAHCTAPCGDSHAADIARGRTYETMVNVSIGVAVVGLVVGTAASIVAVVRSRSRRAESSRGVRPFAGGWTF
jgi:hypothetical protein